MSYLTAAKIPGRRAASIVEIDSDRCSLVYGESPCTADLALANLFINSTALSGGSWTRTAVNTDADVASSPLTGAATADRMRPTTGNTIHSFEQSITTGFENKSTDAALSFCAKAEPAAIGLYENIRVELFSGFIPLGMIEINLDQGQIRDRDDAPASLRGYKILKYGTWYRVIIGVQIPSIVTVSVTAKITFLDINGNDTFAGDGVNGILFSDFMYRDGANEFGPGKFIATAGSQINNGDHSKEMCFNTLATCKDLANYTKGTSKTFRFIEQRVLDDSIIEAYPCVKKIDFAPTKINPGKGLSIRSTVTVTMQDFTSNDTNVDPYYRDRGIDPVTNGTFFGKWKVRNKYYIGRELRILEGYLDQDGALTDYLTRAYIIDNVAGPDKNGLVQITGKDVLNLARNEFSECPVAKYIELDADLNDTDTTGIVIVGDDIADLAVNDYIRIDDEILEVTAIAGGDTLTVVRAQWGTEVDEHTSEAAVQICKVYENTLIITIINDLLVNYAGVDASFIPASEWIAESVESMSGFNLTTCISEPTGVTDLLQELVDCTLLDLWFDDIDQKIKLKLQTPFIDVTKRIDDDIILKDSMKVKELDKDRITRVYVHYGRRNFATDADEASNYSRLLVEVAANNETDDYYGDKRTREIFTSWMDSGNTVQAGLTASRLIDRYGNPPLELSFEIDAKDVEVFKVGEVYDIDSRYVTDSNGVPRFARLQVTESRMRKMGDKYMISCLGFFPEPEELSNVVISTNQTDYNLHNELGNPSGPIVVQVTINGGVIIDATQGNAAFTTGGLHPDSKVTLINNGSIYGYSGTGGRGGDGQTAWTRRRFGSESLTNVYQISQPSVPQSGGNGGTAIEITNAIFTLDNTSGSIRGGGGGGAGSSIAYYQQTVFIDTDLNIISGASGGGGAGSDPQLELAGTIKIDQTARIGVDLTGDISVNDATSPSPEQYLRGDQGTAGSTSAVGTGGVARTSNFVGSVSNFAAGDGGDWGEAGDDSGDGIPGGRGGYGINTNGSVITYLDGGPSATDIRGEIV